MLCALMNISYAYFLYNLFIFNFICFHKDSWIGDQQISVEMIEHDQQISVKMIEHDNQKPNKIKLKIQGQEKIIIGMNEILKGKMIEQIPEFPQNASISKTITKIAKI
jgi:hypothetical protein